MNYILTIALLFFTIAIQTMELQFPIDPKNPEFQRRVALYTGLAKLDTQPPIATPSYFGTVSICSFAHPYHDEPERLDRCGQDLVNFCKQEKIIPTAPAISDTLIHVATPILNIPIYNSQLLANAVAMKYSAYLQNNSTALHHIGAMLYNGKFLQQDIPLGKQLVQRAAKTNLEAQADLIKIYLTEKKYPEATALLYRIAHDKEYSECFRLKKLLEHEVVVHIAKNNNQRLRDQENKVLEHSAKKFYLKALALFHKKDYKKALPFLRIKECIGFIPAQFLEGLILRLHSSQEHHQAGQEHLLEGIACQYLPALLMSQVVNQAPEELDCMEYSRQATYGDAFLLTAIRYLREHEAKHSPDITLDYLRKSIMYGNPENFPDLFPYMYTYILASNSGLTAHIALYFIKILEETLASTDKNKFTQADQILQKLKCLKNCPRACFSALLTMAAYSQANVTLVPEHWQNNAHGIKAYKLLQKKTTPLIKYIDGTSFSQLQCLAAAIDNELPSTAHAWGTALALRRVVAAELPLKLTKKVTDFVRKKNNAHEPFLEQELPFFLALSLTTEASLKNLIEKVVARSEKIPDALPTKSALYDYIEQKFGPLDWVEALYWKANTLLDSESCFKCSVLRLGVNFVHNPKIPIERSPLTSDYAYALLAYWFDPLIYTNTLGLFCLRHPVYEHSVGEGISLCTEDYNSLIAIYVDYYVKKDKCKELMAHVALIEQRIEHWKFSIVLKYAVLITILCHTKDQTMLKKCEVFWLHVFKKAPAHLDEQFMELYKTSRKFLDLHRKIKGISNLCSLLDLEAKKIAWFKDSGKELDILQIKNAIAIASNKAASSQKVHQ